MDTLTTRSRRRATRPAGSPGTPEQPSVTPGTPDAPTEPDSPDLGSSESAAPDEVAADEVTADEVAADEVAADSGDNSPPPSSRRRIGRRLFGWGVYVLVLLVLGGVAITLVVIDHRTTQDAAQRERLLAGARQTALNMTTLQADSAQADVDRLLAGASGDFLSQFQDRQSDFVDVVGQAGVNSTGTVVAAGIESTDGNCAIALVAADAQVANVEETTPTPRAFRFRIRVCEVDGNITADNVEFVP
ncbi:MAG: hypothetical protein WBF79_16820 [Rhodococcus sp. (in: high G+C Gram-positive bacteria)]